jgi:putative membrane protein
MNPLKLLNPIRVLIIIYIVGIIGVTVLRKDFMLLTPLNLLTTFFIAVYADKYKNASLYIILAFCYLFGFFLELLGVQTGVIFGAYEYGATLGPKIWETPLIIGIIWAMLVYASVSISNSYFEQFPTIVKAAIGASLMVLLDIFIEPVAVEFDFWSWTPDPMNKLIVAPLENYIVWWLAAFLLNYLVQIIVPAIKNRTIEVLFYLQLLFFIWILIFVMKLF